MRLIALFPCRRILLVKNFCNTYVVGVVGNLQYPFLGFCTMAILLHNVTCTYMALILGPLVYKQRLFYLGQLAPYIVLPTPLCVTKQNTHTHTIKLELFWFIVFPMLVPCHKEWPLGIQWTKKTLGKPNRPAIVIGNMMNQKDSWGTWLDVNLHPPHIQCTNECSCWLALSMKMISQNWWYFEFWFASLVFIRQFFH